MPSGKCFVQRSDAKFAVYIAGNFLEVTENLLPKFL